MKVSNSPIATIAGTCYLWSTIFFIVSPAIQFFLDAFDMADILFCKNLFLKSDLDHKNLIEEKDFLKFKR